MIRRSRELRYREAASWARAMGHEEAADLLQETLDEEKAADQKLTALAESGINQGAADIAHPGDKDSEDMASAGSGAKRRSAKTTRRQ